MPDGNGQASSDLAAVVKRAHELVTAIYRQWESESHDARWFRAPADLAHVAGGGMPADRTAQSAMRPDPVNTQRADELERLLRRVYADLFDAAQESRRRCQAPGCDERPRPRGLCELHY